MIISNFLNKLLMFSFSELYKKVYFNCNDWKLNRKNRYQYIQPIIQDSIGLGFSETEIIELLGSPDRIYKNPEYTLWSYDAGKDFLKRRYSLHLCFKLERVYQIAKKQKLKKILK